jgi:hypothetical protein
LCEERATGPHRIVEEGEPVSLPGSSQCGAAKVADRGTVQEGLGIAGASYQTLIGPENIAISALVPEEELVPIADTELS